MNAAKDAIFKKAKARAAAEPDLTKCLGIVLLVALEEIARMEALAGTDLDHTYYTEFSTPDGQRWELVLSKQEASDAG